MSRNLKHELYLPTRGEKLPVISVCQPWASMIISGLKVKEHRTQNWNYRGPFLVHASATKSDRWCKDAVRLDMSKDRYMRMPRGGIVGVARLVDVVNESRHGGHIYGYMISEPVWLPQVVREVGRLGVFYPTDAVWKIIRPLLKRLDAGERFPPIVEGGRRTTKTFAMT